MSLFKILKGDSSRISTDVTPFHDGYAYFTPDDGGFYIDATTGGQNQRIRVNESKVISVTLRANGWSGSTQTIAVEGLKSDQNGIASVPHTITDSQLEALGAAKLLVTGQGNGTLTVTAKGTVPEIDIPIAVILLG